MIGHLLALIAQAEKQIGELKVKITESETEVENCTELKSILTRIADSSFKGYTSLEKAGNSLNKGIKISGMGQGYKILERAAKIKNLSSKTSIAEANVQNRMVELDDNIKSYKNKIVELKASIAGWQGEIARLEEIARQQELERQRNLARQNASKKSS